MKPNFALTLTFDGIGVLHRAFPGWHLVGDVALDTEDLHGELARLRDMAQALDPSGLRTKLVIPNDQIKYLHFDIDGLGPDEIGDAVARALDGATPYKIDDLAYDWSISAGQVYVAAAARETLAEAEAFALEHGFNPLAFVAIPEARDFVGEPWFGETANAANVLPKGGFVERDTAAIRIIGAAQLPDAAPSDARDLPSEPVVEVEDRPLPEPEQAPEPDPTPEPDPAPDTGTAPADAAPVSEGEPAPAVAFSSIRARRDDTPAKTPRLTGATRDTTAAPAPAKPSRKEPPVTAVPPAPAPDAPQITGTPDSAVADTVAARIGASLRPTEADRLSAENTAESVASDAPPPPEPASGPAAPSFFTRRTASLKRALARPAKPVPAAAATTQPLEPQDEKQRMTIFGAREPARVGGKPRFLGLILTAVLLLFLVGVAAWASIFLDDGLARLLRSDPETEIAATPEPEPDSAPLAEVLTTPPDPAQTAPDEDTRLAALPDDSLIDAEDPARDPLPAAQPSRLSPDEARARYAVTGIWQRAPDTPRAPEVLSLDDFYLTSIDPKVIEQDAVALPGADSLMGDRRPATPGLPPAPGTTFEFDQRGLVRATPEGALTPDGVRVYAGQPPVAMPPRPAPPAADPETAFLADPALARLVEIRPRPRPGDLSEQNERGQLGLGGRTRAELAVLRPRLRPQSAQELAQQAAAASTAALVSPDADTIQEAVAEAVDPFAGATAQAVALSIKPKPRPGNFARIVQRAEETQTATPVPAAQRVAPSAPTATTVARAATERNALSLRRVNLIGVYGTASDRRALVRLANGRYQKVKIGDRLDGGRVSAIGTSELRYVKSGRSVVLKMPRG
ncbi:hypothetical protein [Roseovarius aestuariivivens]|uniref:hypothetical protein n=1 Tax=Roseovarius aestuariivivens TaxID=1888910 RepID=UPI00108171D9|nr:hypothetical protein [Roseovarius aestuariivivens]